MRARLRESDDTSHLLLFVRMRLYDFLLRDRESLRQPARLDERHDEEFAVRVTDSVPSDSLLRDRVRDAAVQYDERRADLRRHGHDRAGAHPDR